MQAPYTGCCTTPRGDEGIIKETAEEDRED
jgi:hypothetical protein